MNRVEILRQNYGLPNDLPLRVLYADTPMTPLAGDAEFSVYDWRLWSETEMFVDFVHLGDREALDALVMLLNDPDRCHASAAALADCVEYEGIGAGDARRVQRAIAGLLVRQKRDPEVARLGGLVDEIVDRHS